MTGGLTREEIKKIIAEAVKEVLSELLPASVSASPSEYPRWLPTREAVKYSGLSKDTLYKLAEEGEIYAVKSPGGGKLLFDRLSIDEYLLREKYQIKAHLDRIKKSIYA